MSRWRCKNCLFINDNSWMRDECVKCHGTEEDPRWTSLDIEETDRLWEEQCKNEERFQTCSNCKHLSAGQVLPDLYCEKGHWDYIEDDDAEEYINRHLNKENNCKQFERVEHE